MNMEIGRKGLKKKWPTKAILGQGYMNMEIGREGLKKSGLQRRVFIGQGYMNMEIGGFQKKKWIWHRGGLSLEWSVMRVVFHQDGLSSGVPLYKDYV